MMKIEENEKEKFFKEITESINKWMLEKYPSFDQKLEARINQLDATSFSARKKMEDFFGMLQRHEEEFLKNATEKVDKYMQTYYPEVCGKSTQLSKELEKNLAEGGKVIKTHEELLGQMRVYKSLCEDVYAMRDQMHDIQKTFSGFKKKLNELFK